MPENSKRGAALCLDAGFSALAGLAIAATAASGSPIWHGAKGRPAENVTISTGKTKNMACTKGVCSPTGKNAVLNVKDLQKLLAGSNIEVTTGNVTAKTGNLTVAVPLSWKSASTLTLDAYNSIFVQAHVAVKGAGGVALVINDGGTNGDLSFDFDKGGQITFANVTSPLTIEGTSFTLVRDIATLASDISANPSGNFALSDSYDAKKDGTYSQSPIQTVFSGVFFGLGNTISNVTIDDSNNNETALGFFKEIDGTRRHKSPVTPHFGESPFLPGVYEALIKRNKTYYGGDGGSVNLAYGIIVGLLAGYAQVHEVQATGSEDPAAPANIGGLVGVNKGGLIVKSSAKVSIEGGATFSATGGLVGEDIGGTISDSFASGSISDTTSNTYTGGLVGYADGTTIENSNSSVNVTVGGNDFGGGLVGASQAYVASTITNSYATGTVQGSTDDYLGGLVGQLPDGAVSDSYATGAVSGTTGTAAGGLIGESGGTIANSYTTGAVTAGSAARELGGLVGGNVSGGTISDSYATGAVTGGQETSAGGLVGTNSGTISETFSTGATTGGSEGWIGGLAGTNYGVITNSYATSAASVSNGAADVDIGGLIGLNESSGTVGDSYSTGAVQQASESYVGGVVGQDESSGGFTDTYWDTTTSGISSPSQGAGNIANDPGLTGLTTAQLQTGLPGGFSDTIWSEDSQINDGLPYLLNNPPPKGQ